ncbi:Fe-S protein assembly co-chaperone HscB, partial [Porticoccaceae bacterium]|nr:Fe-S protein assembly co-chaperone HscB [Porticoccaceae bacterium]
KVDLSELNRRYLSLQQEFHPDRHAKKSDLEQRLAVQMATLINQAFETLKSPVHRAQYLLELRGVVDDEPSKTTSDSVFLMQQIELREALASISSSDDPWWALDRLAASIRASYADLQGDFHQSFGAERFDEANRTVAKMQYFTKLLDQVRSLEDSLEDI